MARQLSWATRMRRNFNASQRRNVPDIIFIATNYQNIQIVATSTSEGKKEEEKKTESK